MIIATTKYAETVGVREMCPKCQGQPVKWKLVEDDTIVGAHQVPVVCQYCNGEGQVELTKQYEWLRK